MSSVGISLAQLRRQGCGVRLTCRDCMKHRDLPLEPIVERLRARGVGGDETGIVELAGLVREPCPRCGGPRFTTAPWWP